MSLEHKGLKIFVDDRGMFKVVSRGDIEQADTLEKIKARIDKALKSEQKPFKALMFDTGSRWERQDIKGIVEVTVTSFTERGNGFRYGRECWIKGRGGRSKELVADVFVDTPENRRKMERTIVLAEKAREATKALDLARDEIVRIAAPNADDDEEG